MVVSAREPAEETETMTTATEALDRLMDLGDETLYTATADEGLVELTPAGVELAESAGLRVDVDDYGCAYCVEATEAISAESERRMAAGEPVR